MSERTPDRCTSCVQRELFWFAFDTTADTRCRWCLQRAGLHYLTRVELDPDLAVAFLVAHTAGLTTSQARDLVVKMSRAARPRGVR